MRERDEKRAGRGRMRETRESRRDRERGDEADQRRVESHEAGSVPFSRSQAPIPFGSVAVPFSADCSDETSQRKKCSKKLRPQMNGERKWCRIF